MHIIFIGPPGSGKGTQGQILSNNLGIAHLSTGDLLRKISSSNSPLGAKIAETIKSGALVTDDVVNQIVIECLNGAEYKTGWILDGYPRTVSQAEFFDQQFLHDYVVLYFKMDTALLQERIVGRYTCKDCGHIYNQGVPLMKQGECDICHSSNFSYRADDNAEVLAKRVDVFEEEISPILSFFESKQKLITINADAAVETVTNQIITAIKNH